MPTHHVSGREASSGRDVAGGRLLLVIASLLWSTNALLVKSPPLQSLPQADRGPLVACYRTLVAGLCVLPFVNWRRARFRLAMLPMVVCFAAMNAMYITALTLSSAAATIFLQYTAVVWAFVFGAVFLGERVTRDNLTTLGFALAGITCIVVGGWHGGELPGMLLALGSGIAYGGVVVSMRALAHEDSAWLVVLNHLAAGLALVPWMLSRGLVPVGDQWLVIITLGAVQMGLPYVLFARGLSHVSSQEASLITLAEAILNPTWVWLAWGERPAPATIVGGGFILAGLLLRYARWPRRD